MIKLNGNHIFSSYHDSLNPVYLGFELRQASVS